LKPLKLFDIVALLDF